ncbi:DUF4062 domain-containing protein [Agathobaculum sp. NSJ-28]|uniref:DUF4062 domain-containing protein n=2 Tax=Agathobaculum TaxID=2048137 RepID=A0A923LX16_9FIRM|nr:MULTISPECIES: DUF4062 domain-containing protein [Agathobaculum]MBC5725479.1 DUF4062 domain-containing protein [Agathobaculum faecis]MCU6789232.1 DUF4062 domain-containing protein [Agathobaculum ammoniilyticum]SCJ12152.1 Uncharacterised protein [uncultured Butyricicoccus sp.]
MSAPKVFVSSTCYDLKQVRQDIESFILSYGYTPILSERHGVTYNVTSTLENDCYNELSQCEIIVGVVGGRYGAESSDQSGNSITMNEMKHAITLNKQIYIFIERNVYTEYATYCSNKNLDGFSPAFVDDVRIFEFIEQIKSSRNIIINDFLTASNIVECLRIQWAGLFQTFLYNKEQQRQSEGLMTIKSLTDELREVISTINSCSDTLLNTSNSLYYNIETTRLSVNPILIHISNILLNLNREPTQFNNNSVIFFKTKNELLDLLEFVFGFEESLENSNMFCLGSKQLFIDLDFMFTSKDTLKFISQNAIQQYEKDNQHPFISIEDTAFELPSNFDDSDVPF